MTAKGYYQSNLLDYFLGEGMTTPPVPNIQLEGVRFNLADIVEDGRIDLEDFSALAAQWQNFPGVPSADIAPIGGNGIVDGLDLQVLCENWLVIKEE
jgi:hypothetical protein